MNELNNKTPYVGRFAPSPTGRLHIGSLLTAVASYADARAHGGRWLVRMEDLDPPREQPGAADDILRTLEAFGFAWDGEVAYQSRRHGLYRDALADLYRRGLVYPCFCSRRTVAAEARRMGADGPVYSGRCACRQPEISTEIPEQNINKSAFDAVFRQPENGKMPAWRLRVAAGVTEFCDRVVGAYRQDVAEEVGDFVLLRADGFWAYQLAVVVDDAEQGVNHIVRGQDLLVSAPRQIELQRCLNLATPQYAHLPLLTNAQGQKWSKQTHAPALDARHWRTLLPRVLRCLGLPDVPEVSRPAELLDWAAENWSWDNVPKNGMATAAE